MRRVNLFNTAALLLISAMFTSCMDDDTEESMYLSGQWTGDFGMYYNYEYRGDIYTFDSYDTDVVFYPDYNYATHGYGYQVDYYREGPYEKMSFRFFWEINRGIIYLDYPGYPEYSTKIRDYHLTNSYFRGYFENGTSEFYLRKLTDYYNWGYYSGYGDYYSWSNTGWNWNNYPYYYSKTRGLNTTENDTLSTEEGKEEGKIVGIGNRFARR